MIRCLQLLSLLTLVAIAGCGGVAIDPETEAKSTDVTAPEEVAAERALAKQKPE